jgi:hypothetical protein
LFAEIKNSVTFALVKHNYMTSEIQSKITFNHNTSIYGFEICNSEGTLIATFWSMPKETVTAFFKRIAPMIEETITVN